MNLLQSIEAEREVSSKEVPPWIGVDFDGTLVVQEKFPKVGKPVGKMVRRVRDVIENGIVLTGFEDKGLIKLIKIFTARAGDPKQVKMIKAWTKKHLGKELEVTNVKDSGCLRIVDNISVRVKKDKGIITPVHDVHGSKQSLEQIKAAIRAEAAFQPHPWSLAAWFMEANAGVAIEDIEASRAYINAGGPGSGRHPWGRKPKPQPQQRTKQATPEKDMRPVKIPPTLSKKGKVVDPTRQAAALKNPSRVAVTEQNFAENLVASKIAKILHGHVYGRDSEPVDVVVNNGKGKLQGIEVKAVIKQQAAARTAAGQLPQVSMKRDAVEKKNNWASFNKSSPVHVVIVDCRDGKGGWSENPKDWKVYHAQTLGNISFSDDTRATAKSAQGGLKGLADKMKLGDGHGMNQPDFDRLRTKNGVRIV